MDNKLKKKICRREFLTMGLRTLAFGSLSILGVGLSLKKGDRIIPLCNACPQLKTCPLIKKDKAKDLLKEGKGCPEYRGENPL